MPALTVYHVEHQPPRQALHKAVGGVVTQVEPQRALGLEHAPGLSHDRLEFVEEFLLARRGDALGALAATAPIRRGGDDAVDALVLDALHHGGGIALLHEGQRRAAHAGDEVAAHVCRRRGFGLLGCYRWGAGVAVKHLAQQCCSLARHLVVGDAAVGFVGKPLGDKLVGIHLEQACQPQHLLALGTALTVLKAAIGRYVHTDSACKLGLTLAAGDSQLLDGF